MTSTLDEVYGRYGQHIGSGPLSNEQKIRALKQAFKMVSYNSNPPAKIEALENVLLIANDVFGRDWDGDCDRTEQKSVAFATVTMAVEHAPRHSEIQHALAARVQTMAPLVLRYAPDEAQDGVDRAIMGVTIGNACQQLDQKLAVLTAVLGDNPAPGIPVAQLSAFV